MTPRLNLNRNQPAWPELFRSISTLRGLRVVIDAELWDDGYGVKTVEKLLSGFLTCPGIEFWRYTENDPPGHAPWRRSSSGGRIAVGWMNAKHVPSSDPDRYLLSYVAHDMGIQWDLAGEPSIFALHDRRTIAYEALEPDEAMARRIADAVAVRAAHQAKADLYVTEREYLHNLRNMTLAPGVTVCSPSDALTLVGLYLRTKDQFLAWKNPGEEISEPFERRDFYLVGARELLPEGWRWFSACVAHSISQESAPDANNLTYLGGAVFQRIAGVLQARDNVMRTVNQKQDSQVIEDALDSLDICLVFLVGALDATARVAHHVLGLPAKDVRNAGWQRKDWIGEVKKRSPELEMLVAPGTSGADTLKIVTRLRNTVHDTGLRSLGIIGLSGVRETTLAGVCLPASSRKEVTDAVKNMGGLDAWSLQELFPEMLHFDPGVLLDRLLPAVLELLNKLMENTPVESLAGVSLNPGDLIPPTDVPRFGEAQRHGIRWQLGL